MMKMLKVAVAMIEEAGFGEEGVDLFIGTIPADVTKGVMLRAPLNPTEVDEGMQNFYDTEFQIIVRDTDPAAGFDRADRISKALRAFRLERDGLSISWLRRRTLPVQYPKGDMDDIETSVHMQVGYGEIVA
jgi:hypothetical protein